MTTRHLAPAIFTSERDLCRIVEETVPEFRSGEWQLVYCHVTGMDEQANKLLVLYSIAYHTREDGQLRKAELVADFFSRNAQARKTYAALRQLWGAGFRDPSQHRITQPYGYAPETRTVVQQKAPGVSWADFVLYRSQDDLLAASAQAADWLAEFHRSGLQFNGAEPRHSASRVERFARDLASALPSHGPRVQALAERIVQALPQPMEVRPSHGDYRPGNVFITPQFTTVTGIEAIGLREPEFDAGYAVTQLLVSSRLATGTSTPGTRAADTFLQRYLGHSPLDGPRLRLHVARTLMQNLHHELCVLRSRRTQMASQWLDLVDRYLSSNGNGIGLIEMK